jgi:hypothetical protein
MAILRCEKCGPPQGKMLSYASSRKLASDTSSRIFCATAKCTRLAFVCWLTHQEEREYVRGERLFKVPVRGIVEVT